MSRYIYIHTYVCVHVKICEVIVMMFGTCFAVRYMLCTCVLVPGP